MTTVPLRPSNPVVAPHTSSTDSARMGSGFGIHVYRVEIGGQPLLASRSSGGGRRARLTVRADRRTTRRFISSAHARAMQADSQPSWVGSPEKP